MTDERLVWVGQQLERIDRKMDMQVAGARRMPLNVLTDPADLVNETPKQPSTSTRQPLFQNLTVDGGGVGGVLLFL
jgi:hypothetical protein